MDNEIAAGVEVQHPLTANAVVTRVRLIQEVMRKVMKKDTHYGVIPGCAKPSLWKPGAEQLLVTFRIAPDQPRVEDLSSSDSVRYRVTRTGISNGVTVASGIGECSSDEEKYKWRAPVCAAEYEATPEDRRRMKWRRDGSSYQQVRTNPADVANTILKMADKRAFVAMTLLATAASDIFTQDLEDLPEEIVQAVEGSNPKPAPIADPQPKAKPAEQSAAKAMDKTDNTVTFIPVQISQKQGSKNGKDWTNFGIKSPEGEWYGTFSEQYGALAVQAKEDKKNLWIKFELKDGYKNVEELVLA